jgi:hypothetical protein
VASGAHASKRAARAAAAGLVVAAGAAANPDAATAPDLENQGEGPGAYLRHRQRARADAEAARLILQQLRGDRDVCWPEEAADHPLVSVVIPTYDRVELLIERSLPSVLSQTYDNLEVIVVGDGSPPFVAERMKSVTDPRVRFIQNPRRGPRPPDPDHAWMMSGSRPFNHGLQFVRGHWIAIQADDDEWTPDHLEVLLSVATEYRLEFVYGDSWMELPDGEWIRLGDWPPRHAGFCAGAVLFAATLRFMEYDEECWRDEEPNDWNLWRRMMEAGVRMGNVEHILFRHYREARHRLAPGAAA